MTDQAIQAISGIVEDASVGPSGGLRISGTNEENGGAAFEFEIAEEAQPGDEVVRDRGAVVFLDPTASAVLGDKTLDVHAHGDHFHFSLADQEDD